MILTVRDRDFKIDFVSNYVYELYEEITSIAPNQANLSIEIGKIRRKFEEEKNTDEKKILGNQLLDEMEKASVEFSALNKRVWDLRKEIVMELVTSNHIEYDEQWWNKKTGPEDINDFMLACLKKDFDLSKSTVKKK